MVVVVVIVVVIVIVGGKHMSVCMGLDGIRAGPPNVRVDFSY